MEVKKTRRTTIIGKESRRQQTIIYKLSVNNNFIVLCKKLFLNTLGISEKFCRTALLKINNAGVLEKDKRGGRQRCNRVKENELLTRK